MQELRSQIALLTKRNAELKSENDFLKGELKGTGYRKRDQGTTDKINLAMERRFAAWVWYREKVLAPTLANIHTIIILALLYLAFGGKMP